MGDIELAQEKVWPIRRYQEFWQQAQADPEGFWAREARRLDWFKTWDKVLDWDPPEARWFVGGLLNASYQCLDRHVKTWRKSKVAIYWEGEPGDTRVLSYSTLYRDVNRVASVLRKLGVGKGDTVVLYLPMIPELPIFMLACARLGAIHSVVFSGFSAEALADRVQDLKAKVVVTADGGYRRGSVLRLKDIVDQAAEQAPGVQHVIVVQRTGTPVTMKEGRDLWLHDLLKTADKYVRAEPVEATHPLYVLYTSGTTGKPKGIVHATGGYMVFNQAVYRWVFNAKEETVYWCTADVGWVTGHSAIVYAPLAHGAAIVMYEGAPDYPTPERWWEIIETYGVNVFYTSPTAIRMFMQHGPELPKRHDLSSLELLGVVGEATNPEAWHWYYQHIGGERCPIVDTWWQTETGGPMISAAPGIELVPMKPGSAGFPLPGVEPEIVDAEGNPVPSGEKGLLVIKKPWPGIMLTIHGDEARYKSAYWERFPGKYYTGDYAVQDEEGYYWLLGRADEVLKIAGHRLGTMEFENAAVSTPCVAEAAAAARPHPTKGEAVVLFAVLRHGYEPSPALEAEVKARVREKLGPVATPEEVVFVKRLPKTRSGKIMRRLLRAVATHQEIGDVTTLEDEASIAEVKRALQEMGVG